MPPTNPINPNQPQNPYGPPPNPANPYQPGQPGSGPIPNQFTQQGQAYPPAGMPPYQQPQQPRPASYNIQPNRQFEQFNRPVPPPQPTVPFFLDPQGPYAHIGQAPAKRRNKRKGLGAVLFGIGGIMLIGIIATIVIIAKSGGSDPDALFQTALQNAMTTNSYSQKATLDQDNIQLKNDVADVKAPRQSGTVDLASANAKLEGYSSIKNSYVRYTQFPDSTSTSTAAILNKWEQIRKDGSLPDTYSGSADAPSGTDEVFDARTAIMGNYIMGNFSDTDRQTLINLILTKGIYSYDSSAVTTEEVEGQAATLYGVKLNGEGLKELNKKAGVIMGLPQDEIDATINKIDPGSLGSASVKMYIGNDSQRLVKVVLTQDGQTTSITYTSFNSSVVANEPAADFQYDEFQTLLTGKAGISVTSKALDTERKSDVNSLASRLEAYYATNGFYPTLANINDPAWRAANFKEVKDIILTDPEGTTNKLSDVPTPKQYSYQPYQDNALGSCDGGACKFFKVAATLSDGNVYTHTSVN